MATTVEKTRTFPTVWMGYAAACWSLGYGILGLYWWSGGAGFPFAPIDDDHRSGSILEGSDAAVVAPVMALLGLGGAAIAVYMARAPRAVRGSWAVIGFGWVMAAGLALVLPDYTLLAFVAFAPALLVFVFTGVPGPQDGVSDIIYWHRGNLLILFAGGVLWAWATVLYHRRIRGACVRCGRVEGHADHERADLLRWGRWAVLVAVLAPVPYEITRIAWFLGVPLGIPHDFLAMMQDTPGMLEVGLGCALASIGGGILTHGLVSRWGEVYPRWMFWRAGRRVPPMLAVIPAAVVAVVLVPAGFMNLRAPVTAGTWATTAPGVLWTVWGVALGAAAITYHLRRRPPCRHCHQG
ncbi:NYN domain-containing protein [Dactylosporangium sp. NPDC049525]|uniref:NYN domain-containing protein n=1 Tax=Dactylosporangium sp. NPDC049525 TaxID=3154730 RepID=UPI003445AF5A